MKHTAQPGGGRSRTIIGSALVALTIGLSLPSMAAAAKPLNDSVPMREHFVLPAGAACDFAVVVDVQANGERYKLWLDADGSPTRGLLTGRLVLQLTNADTDASVVLNVSGPGHDRFNADGTIDTAYTGRGLPFFDGVFYLSVGRDDFTVSENWDMLEHGSKSGRSLDICAMLS
ncbi:MAG TPA: hypothetical protein VK838_05090 [Candidatus Limnocylindrales bacterium]|nr:hypothetical protein [Candidatus Limnocylindrales bacterium]